MGRYADAAEKARVLTNKELATEMAAIMTINRDKINQLLPNLEEKQLFLDLMKQVEEETNTDNNIAYLQENLTKVGSVLFKVLKGVL